MSQRGRAYMLALGLVFLFVVSLVPPTHHEAAPLTEKSTEMDTTPLGQAQKLTIGSWPDGANQRVEFKVPDGHSIKSLDVDISAATLGSSMALSLIHI